MRAFHISVIWWSFTGIWVTARLLKSPGLFSVFWPFSTMLLFGFVFQLSSSSVTFNSPLVTVPNPPIRVGIIVTSMFHSFFLFPSKVYVFILLFPFSQFYSVFSRYSKVDNFASSLFLLLITMSVRSNLKFPVPFFVVSLSWHNFGKGHCQDNLISFLNCVLIHSLSFSTT